MNTVSLNMKSIAFHGLDGLYSKYNNYTGLQGADTFHNSSAVFGKTLKLCTHKVFLQFLYPEGVYFMNQVNALPAPLGNLHNIQMKSANTKKEILWNYSLKTWSN